MDVNCILNTDCLSGLKELPDECIDCCVTSPPYFRMRDYGVDGQIGLERTPEEYVSELAEIFQEVFRVLKNTGTLWLNLGDCYNGSGKAGTGKTSRDNLYFSKKYKNFGKTITRATAGIPVNLSSLKPKDLIGIPWMVAFALRSQGWYLRNDIIWCLSGGAYVYAKTQTGEIPVMIKDLVRLDPRTVKLWNGTRWVNVLGWGKSTDTGKRIEIVLRSGERIGCTGSHVWPTRRGNVAAGDLRAGDILQSCTFAEPEIIYKPPYLSDDLLWLTGLYLAEGSRSGHALQISLNIDEKKWIPRIRNAVNQAGGSVTYTECGKNLAIRIYGKVIHAVIADFLGGDNAKNKRLTSKCWSLSNKDLSILMGGYLDGDGHYEKENNRWRLGFCRNYLLERDIRLLAARLGATLTLIPATSGYQNGRKPSFKGEWRWERSGHFNEKDRNEIVQIRNGRARQYWDISVECESHLFALASGVLTHNCKPNAAPESVRDRCTKSHEHIFLMSKARKYYYDYKAISEKSKWSEKDKRSVNGPTQSRRMVGSQYQCKHQGVYCPDGLRNKRDVWTVNTAGFKDAHFATYPPALITDCIKAGCPPGGIVLDPFMGAGTTAVVAESLGRNYIGFELNSEYVEIANTRILKEREARLH